MNLESTDRTPDAVQTAGVFRGIVVICAVGVLLGVSYNWFGLQGPKRWGLSWIAQDSKARLADAEMVTAGSDGSQESSDDPYQTNISDPLAAVGNPTPEPALPEIRAVGRPVQIDLSAVRMYVDAGAALIVDARDEYEYDEGHIPGAINIPYDRVISEPELLEQLDDGGRPIIAYCGGGECEVSMNLAEELLAAGHRRVAVYMGGFPEWQEAGLPVATAGGAG